MHKEIFYTNKDINEIKIALFSDIHFHKNFKQKIFDKILKQIIKEEPNYICIPGDFIDSSDIIDLLKLKNFLENLSKIAKTFIVLGNHDEKKGKRHNWSHLKNQELLKLLTSIPNIYLLNDSSITIDNITFYGFNLSYNYYEIDIESYESFCQEVAKLKGDLNNNTYNIILLHSPFNIYSYMDKNPNHFFNKSDLILSGHMHNGCLPFIISHPFNKIFNSSSGLLAPNRQLFPKYAQGRVYNHNGYIYEGLTKISPSSSKFLSHFDWIFQKKVEFITIKKQEKTSSK